MDTRLREPFMCEFYFRLMGASQNKSDVTNRFLIGGLVIHFAGFFHLSASVQKLFKSFMFVQWLIFFLFLGANMTPTIFFVNLETPKRQFLEKICVD
jgi:hypothetical protein